MLKNLLLSMDRLWVIGRRSNLCYVRFYPNPGFMFPWFGNKRVRWSVFYGLALTKAPTPENARGI